MSRVLAVFWRNLFRNFWKKSLYVSLIKICNLCTTPYDMAPLMRIPMPNCIHVHLFVVFLCMGLAITSTCRGLGSGRDPVRDAIGRPVDFHKPSELLGGFLNRRFGIGGGTQVADFYKGKIQGFFQNVQKKSAKTQPKHVFWLCLGHTKGHLVQYHMNLI